MILKRNLGTRAADAAIYLGLAAFSFVCLAPFIHVVMASISEPLPLEAYVGLLLRPLGFTVKGYQLAMSIPSIKTGFLNTFIIVFTGTVINLVMTCFAAYVISQKNWWYSKAVTIVAMVTMFFTGGLIPTYLIVRALGLMNSVWALVLPTSISMWNMIIMRTFFQNSVPYELHESAYIDGCTEIGVLVRIVLPLSTSILAVMIIFYGVSHWNAYFSALVYLTDKTKYPLQLVLREILITDSAALASADSQSVFDMMMMAEKMKYAVIVVASVPVLMLYPFAQRYFVKGVMIGAIKG